MLPWLHLQNLHFSESGMEVISNQENYFRQSSFGEFLTIENFCETLVEPFSLSQLKMNASGQCYKCSTIVIYNSTNSLILDNFPVSSTLVL